MALTPGKEDRMLRNYTTFEYWSSNNNKWTQLLPWLAQQAINFCKIKSVVFNYHYSDDQVASSLRSMAVLSIRAQERRSREKNKKLLPPQSPRGLSALARLYYLARPTKTAMLRRLSSLLLVVHINLVKMHNCECSALLVLRRKVEFWHTPKGLSSGTSGDILSLASCVRSVFYQTWWITKASVRYFKNTRFLAYSFYKQNVL